MRASMLDWTQAELIAEITTDVHTNYTRNTMVTFNPIFTGQMDGVAECIASTDYVVDNVWWYARWTEYEEVRNEL